MRAAVAARAARAVLIVAASFHVVHASAQTPPEEPVGSSIASAAAEARLAGLSAARKLARSEGGARIIVQFDPQPALSSVPTTMRDPTARRTAAIQATRASLVAALRGTAAHRIKAYDRLPMVAMEVEEDALDVLATEPTVVGIQIDRKNRPTLAQSIAVIDADGPHADGDIGADSVIAVLDTGIDRTHPFFGGRVIAEACFSTTTRTTQSACPDGAARAEGPGAAAPCASLDCDHGTHVAGIAAGSGSRRRGVAPGAGIIAIQVFSDEFRACGGLPAPCPIAFDSDILMGLNHVLALSDDFDVAAANLSLGGGRFTSHCDAQLVPYRTAIETLRARGIVTVIASGNDGFDGAISSPACISSAIAVGSTTKTDQLSFFSNHATILDLLAPGSSIRSSVPGGGFATFDGTSMATPHVAGAVALLKSAEPDATIDEIERALRTTGRSLQRAGIRKPRIDVDSALAALRGEDQPPPENDLLADALLFQGAGGSDRGVNIGATSEPGEPVHAGAGGGASVWWRWRPPFSGDATITTAGSTFDTVLAVYRGGAVDRLNEVVSNDDAFGLGRRSSVSFVADSSRTYKIAVDGAGGATGDITLNVSLTNSELAGTDQFGQAPRLRGRSGAAAGSTLGATAQRGEPVHAGVGGGSSIWWRWRAPFTGLVTFTTIGSDFDTVLAVYRGRRVNRLREVASNDDVGGILQSEVTFRARRDKVYRIAVDGFQGAEGDVVLTFGPPNETSPSVALAE